MNRFSVLLLTLFVFAIVAESHAQASRQVTNIDRRIQTMNRQARDYERENMGRHGKNSKDERARQTRQLRVEIEQDLKALQASYNEIVVALQEGAVKPGFAAETARTIARHSERLKSNLALPSLGEGSETEPLKVPEQERTALGTLGRSIYEFITNPIFEGTTALDVKESTRASRDLDAVIAISHGIASRSN